MQTLEVRLRDLAFTVDVAGPERGKLPIRGGGLSVGVQAKVEASVSIPDTAKAVVDTVNCVTYSSVPCNKK